jgi:uncharacterized phage infection (PIP) family protein YhgE
MSSETGAAVSDIHGIINLDALSTFFSQLTQQINKQNQVIAQIQNKLESFVTLNQFDLKISLLNNAIYNIEEKLAQLKEATTATLKDSK